MFIRVIFLCLALKLICGLSSTGDNIVQRLTDRYNDVTKVCYDPHKRVKPAFQCSGIMTRSVSNIGGPQQKYAWSKMISKKRRTTFSVAFLRRDQPFKTFPFNCVSGFIYYPQLQTPVNKYGYRAYCAFPINAVTDARSGSDGCGKYSFDLPTSQQNSSCAAEGIEQLAQWRRHFLSILKTHGDEDVQVYQCAFDLTSKNAVKNFALAIEAKKFLRHASRKYGFSHNELVLRAWNEKFPEKLPIEAFFYERGSNKGRDEAFMYQSDYFQLTNETVPVVSIKLPTESDPDLHVAYDPTK